MNNGFFSIYICNNNSYIHSIPTLITVFHNTTLLLGHHRFIVNKHLFLQAQHLFINRNSSDLGLGLYISRSHLHIAIVKATIKFLVKMLLTDHNSLYLCFKKLNLMRVEGAFYLQIITLNQPETSFTITSQHLESIGYS